MTNEQTLAGRAEDTASAQKKVIRRRFLQSVTGVLLVLAIIGLPLSLLRIFSTGLHFNHITHICMALLVFAIFFTRKRLSSRWLISSILFIFTVLSISAFLQYGVVSAGFYFAGACIFVAGVGLGLWSGVICAGFYLVVASIVAYLWMSGQLVFPSDVNEYILLPSVWGTLAISFIIGTAVFFVSATGFIKGLTELVDTIDAQKKEIEIRTAEVSRANQELKKAMKEIKTLHGLLPMCSNCKKIRDDQGYWRQVEEYVEHNTDAEFTHSLCPDCISELYPEIAEQVLKRIENKPPK